jgi:tyrosyl-tRNA synthetase
VPSAPPVVGDNFALLDLFDELRWRGMLAQTSAGTEERLKSGRPLRVFNGFDPTGPSLHIGHLLPLFGLRAFQRAGATPVVVLGGATAMVGDPSGRSSERNLADRAVIAANTSAIAAQIGRFLDQEGPNQVVILDNHDWLKDWSLLDFLRDIGKHFSINTMLVQDSVANRLKAGGLSFTEFAYMTLQAADFLHLHQSQGVEMQTGGSDQWGNITAGLSLIGSAAHSADPARATASVGGPAVRTEPAAFGLTFPLLIGANGQKFGKSASGDNIWLDPARTSSFAFFQHWLNVPDSSVGMLLRFFTEMDQTQIKALEAAQVQSPQDRPAQRALAVDITARIHGAQEADLAAKVSAALFARELDLALVPAMSAALGAAQVSFEDLSSVSAQALGLAAGAFSSKGDARRLIGGGAVTINGVRIDAIEQIIPDPIAGRFFVLRVGPSRVVVVRLGSNDGD